MGELFEVSEKLFEVVFDDGHDEECHARYYCIDDSQVRRKFYQTHPHGVIKRIVLVGGEI